MRVRTMWLLLLLHLPCLQPLSICRSGGWPCLGWVGDALACRVCPWRVKGGSATLPFLLALPTSLCFLFFWHASTPCLRLSSLCPPYSVPVFLWEEEEEESHFMILERLGLLMIISCSFSTFHCLSTRLGLLMIMCCRLNQR